MWEPVALCCFTRRTGCLVLGSLEVIGAALSLVLGTYLWFNNDIGAFNSLCRQAHMSPVEDCVELLQHGVSDLAIMCGVVQMVCAVMMIIGVLKNEHLLIAPFLIKNAAAVVVLTILAGIAIVLVCIDDLVLGSIAAYVYGAVIFMWTYFLLTVRAYYYELRRGQADDCHKLIKHCETGDVFPH